MIFKTEMIKKFLIKKTGMEVDKIYKVGNNFVLDGDVFMECNSTIYYYVDTKNTPGYNRFNISQMMTETYVSYKELLSYTRTKKLDSL